MTLSLPRFRPASGIMPAPQYDDRPAAGDRDFAAAGSFSMYALERMLRDCAEQPDWRLRAAVCAAYYDGKQLSELQRWHCRQEDLEERAINLIRPVVNSVLGQEARSRTDVKLEADDDAYVDVSLAISARLKEAEREARAHMAVSEAYAGQVKKGLGWVHVDTAADPLAYRYRVESVPIDEIWWDWRGQKGVVLDDRCRWLVRMQMKDLDELEAAMPRHRKVLQRCANGWEDRLLSMDGNVLGEPEAIDLTDAYDNERRFATAIRKWDWIDTARKMIKVFEVWYRVPAIAVMLKLSPTRTVLYNDRDPRHVEAVARGLVKIIKGPTSQVRRALYAGPHRLLDEATTRRSFPYVPFFAFRDDADGSPYGLIDGMIAPQDEYNERRLRVQWMLKARQIELDSDALDEGYNTLQDIAEAIQRPDMVAILNPNRMNKAQGIKVRNDLTVQREQFELMADSKELIQHTAGRFNSQLGSAQVQSGIANSLLIEQGEQSMGEMNDNYTTGRKAVFDQLVDRIIEDHSEARTSVPVGSGKTRRLIVLNDWQPPVDAAGQPIAGAPAQPVNMVQDAEIRTGLAETPNTPAYRQQTQQQIKEIITALGNNPQATAVLAPAYIESTSHPDRMEVANALRKASGVPIPGDKEGQAQAEAQQQQMLVEQQQAGRQQVAAKIDVDVSAAERNRAQARYSEAQTRELEARLAAGGPQADVAHTVAQTQQSHTAAIAANDEDSLINDALEEASAA